MSDLAMTPFFLLFEWLDLVELYSLYKLNRSKTSGTTKMSAIYRLYPWFILLRKFYLVKVSGLPDIILVAWSMHQN